MLLTGADSTSLAVFELAASLGCAASIDIDKLSTEQ